MVYQTNLSLCFVLSLRELGSFILRDTPKPRQFKAPGPKPTINQLKEARKGNGSPPKRGTDGPVRGADPP